MVEPLMYLGLGFLLASFLAVLFFPVVHGRAVRLTKRRLEAAAPFSIAEMQADKDQLRAEFAVANRRLEMMLAAVKEKEAAHLADLGEKIEAVSRLKSEVEAKTATIAGLESTVKRLTDNLTAATDEMELKRAAQTDAERELGEIRAKLAEAENRYGESSMAGDRQRIEMVALQTQLATVKDRYADAERALAAAEKRRLDAQAEASLGNAEVSAQIEAGLRAEVARLQRQGEALRAEKLQLQGQLERARADRDKLQRELATVSRGGGASAVDGNEAAILRERVSDVAAEIARLTAALEGPDSPIEAMMRRELGTPTNGAGNEIAPSRADRTGVPGSLADRIRALQGRAARVSSAS